MLTCTICNKQKEEEDFPVASVKKSGRAGECKECKSTRIKKLRIEREYLLYNLHNKECSVCKITHSIPSFFDFHHKNKGTKVREVKQILCGSLESLMKEVEKCVMLCPNCHREIHLKEGWK